MQMPGLYILALRQHFNAVVSCPDTRRGQAFRLRMSNGILSGRQLFHTPSLMIVHTVKETARFSAMRSAAAQTNRTAGY